MLVTTAVGMPMHLRICLALLGSAVVIAGLAGMLAAVIMCMFAAAVLVAVAGGHQRLVFHGVSDGNCSTKATSDQM